MVVVTQTHALLVAQLESGLVALDPGARAHQQVVLVLVDHGEGGVRQLVHVRVLVVVVLQRVRLTEVEGDAHLAVLSLHVHLQGQDLLGADDDEATARSHGNHVVDMAGLALLRHGELLSLHGQLVALPGASHDGHATVVDEQVHAPVELSHLDVVHVVVDSLVGHVAVDGGSRTRPSVALTINAHGGARSDLDPAVKVGEVVGVALVLNGRLRVNASH